MTVLIEFAKSILRKTMSSNILLMKNRAPKRQLLLLQNGHLLRVSWVPSLVQVFGDNTGSALAGKSSECFANGNWS